MAEPVAGLLTAGLCDEFSSAFIKDIVKQVQDRTSCLFSTIAEIRDT